MTLERLKELKRVTSEKEYWVANKLFIDAVDDLNKRLYRQSPVKSLETFTELMHEGARIGVISEKDALERQQKVMSALNAPNDMKIKMINELKKRFKFFKK